MHIADEARRPRHTAGVTFHRASFSSNNPSTDLTYANCRCFICTRAHRRVAISVSGRYDGCIYIYIYGATLVRIDSRQTRIKKHIVSFLFPFPFFFFTSSRTEKYKVKSTEHFNISEGTIFSTKHFRLCAHANTSVSVGEIFNAAGDDRKSR